MSLYKYAKIGDIKSVSTTKEVAGVDVKDMIECTRLELGGFQRIDERRTAAGEQVLTPVKIQCFMGKHSVPVFKAFSSHGDQNNALKIEIITFHYSHTANNSLEKACKYTFEGAKISSYRIIDEATAEVGSRAKEEIEFVYNKVTISWTGDGGNTEHSVEWGKRA